MQTVEKDLDVFDNEALITNLPARISSVDSAADVVFVGTYDGHVLQYTVVAQSEKDQERARANSNASTGANQVLPPHLSGGPSGPRLQGWIEKKKFLDRGKKSVEQLKVLQKSKLIICFCDGQVDILSQDTLDIVNTLPSTKGAIGFLTDHRTSLASIAIRCPKKVSIYRHNGVLGSSTFDFSKEVMFSRKAISIEWLGEFLYIGYKKSYAIFDLSSGRERELNVNPGSSAPMVKLISPNILVRSDNVGYMLDMEGASAGTQITWSQPPVALGFHFPYLVSLETNQVEVHNTYDQALVQVISFQSIAFQILSDGPQLLLASPTKIHVLLAMALDNQVRELLKRKCVKEAIDLFQHSHKQRDQAYFAKLRKLYGDAGVILFTSLRFNSALEHLSQSDLNPRSIVRVFPKLLPSNDPLHADNFDFVNIITQNLPAQFKSDQSTVNRTYDNAIGTLKEFLERRRKESKESTNNIIDTALIKIYGANHQFHDAMIKLLSTPTDFSVDDVVDYLSRLKRYNAVAYVYRSKGLTRKALEVWQKLGTNELQEKGRDGVDETVDTLASSTDLQLIWDFSPWVIERDRDKAILIFTSARRLPAMEVLDYLGRFGGKMKQLYLEHLIMTENNNDEIFHTMLALNYIDTIQSVIPPNFQQAVELLSKMGSEGGLLAQTRIKLIQLLEKSNYYNSAKILARIKDSPLFEEQIRLYTKMGQYQQAMKILVSRVRDLNRAEKYCEKHTRDDDQLFLVLLKIYLDEKAPDEEVSLAALNLLKNYASEFPPSKVLDFLPPNFPINQLVLYFTKNIQSELHNYRESIIEKNIRRTENVQVKYKLAELKNRSVTITKDTTCAVCSRRINDQVFASYPNGTIVHFKCFKDQHIDPATNRDFRKKPQQFN